MEQKLIVTSSPHVRSGETVQNTMKHVIIALLPAGAMGVYTFGMRAALLIAVCVVSAVLAEMAFQNIRKKPVTINDLSAVVTGLLLAYNVTPTLPLWMAAVGSVFAIVVGKQVFGGLGFNFINPALAGRAFLMAAYTQAMTSWAAPGPDAVTTATPLGIIKMGAAEGISMDSLPSLTDALIGSIGGCIGETSAILLLLGGAYLIWKGVIRIHVPAVYIGTVAVLTMLFTGGDVQMTLYQLFAGGLMLGAIFMATDYSSSPITYKGQLLFAMGCGIITAVIRFFGGYPEGVSYSILIMNVCTPLIEKYTSPRVFGGGR